MKSSKGLSIAGLVCGCVSVVFAYTPYVNIATIILGIVGIVLSVMGAKQAKANGESKGLATAGLIVSIVGLVMSVIGFFSCTVCSCIAKNADNIIDLADLSSIE